MKEKIYPTILRGRFVDRPNRFVSHVEIDGKVELCHMPNPGRMRELLFPGVTMYVTPNGNPKSRTAFRVIGVEKGETIFYLDTARCNDVAAHLVNHGKIPGWEDYFVARREVTMGDSRFDLLLCHRDTGETFPVEVKSCSLSAEKGAMFPDAPTERGVKHIRHLTEMAKAGEHAGLLILVHDSHVRWFLPDMHTDPDFAAAFGEAMDVVDWKAAAITWTPDFYMPEEARLLPSSRAAIENEGGDRGAYLLVLEVKEEKEIEGAIAPAGYYVYAGWATEHLQKEMNHYRNKRKRATDAVDAIRQEATITGLFPIRSSENISKEVTNALAAISDGEISISFAGKTQKFFTFKENPIHKKDFTELEAYFQIDRLDVYFKKG